MTRIEMEYLIEQLRNADSMRCFWERDMKWWLRRARERRAAGEREQAKWWLARARERRASARQEAELVAEVTAKMLEACHD
ncbi:hypothetical protein N2M06_13420 [Oceanimonas sp. AH20CE76]|uniref:hypothetical protein n=1 Tax=Oceanimonas sp. AH20CE76 TaxID=2977120 RepID=UPI0031FE7FE5